MNPITVMQTETEKRTAMLKAKLTELLGQSGGLDELHIENLADPADQVRSNADREMAIHRLDSRTRTIHDIRAALERIAEGTYGLCEDCEEPIAKRRLDAVPWARLCVTCQEKHESKTRPYEAVLDHAA
jgi:DnaK suppressor protein